MKTWLKTLAFTLLLAGFLAPVAAQLDEGTDYRPLNPPVANHTDSKREVVEVFWYGCGSCFHFEPMLKEWLKSKPEDVAFVRLPAIFSPVWELHARLYYTVEALDRLDTLHPAIFDAIHVRGNKLDTMQKIEEFMTANGVSATEFRNTFNSFMVDSKMRRAQDLTRRYSISGVPSMVVNGRHMTDGNMGGGHAGMLRIVNQLLKLPVE